jgi:hypothetical protein
MVYPGVFSKKKGSDVGIMVRRDAAKADNPPELHALQVPPEQP